MWRLLNAENQVLKYVQIFAARKNQADWEILAFAKNQADLWNPCVCRKSGGFVKSLRLQKVRRICEILAFTESQADDRILAGVELPAPLPYCTGCLYRPAMPGNGSISPGNQKSSFRLKFHRFLSNHKNPNSANKRPITEPKKRTWSLLLSNISCHTHDLQLEAILKI